MTKQNEFDVTIKAAGIDIHRKVDDDIGRRIVSILLGAEEADQNETTANGDHTAGNAGSKMERHPAAGSREAFFAELKNGKPSDNALATAAYHYSQYGSTEFSVEEMRELADDVGVTVPERLDMTYVQAKRNGHRLFRRGGRGAFRPTVHGEAFFKEAYKVSKGTNRKPIDVIKGFQEP